MVTFAVARVLRRVPRSAVGEGAGLFALCLLDYTSHYYPAFLEFLHELHTNR